VCTKVLGESSTQSLRFSLLNYTYPHQTFTEQLVHFGTLVWLVLDGMTSGWSDGTTPVADAPLSTMHE